MDLAVILAGGKGTKIFPYSDTLPKATLPLGDKNIIEYQVESLLELGINQIIVVTGHLGEQIKNALRKYHDIKIIHDKALKGTSHALKISWNEIKEHVSDKFLVMYGDIVTSKETIKKVLDKAKSGADIVVLSEKLSHEKPNDWICSKNDNDRVEYILAHPRHRVTHRLGGIFVLNLDFKRYIDSNPGFMLHVPVGVMVPKEEYLEESLAIAIDDNIDVRSVEPEHFLVDVDKPWHIIEANQKYLEYLFSKINKNIIEEDVDISERAEISGKLIAKKGAKIKSYAEIRGDLLISGNSIVGKCIIGDKVAIGRNSIVDEYCRIEPLTTIKNNVKIKHGAEVGGVIMDGVSIVHYSEIYGVIGRYTDIGAATVVGTLKFDDSQATIRIKGRKEYPPRIGNGAYLGDFVRTGVNAIIMPGIRVGPYSAIGPGVILYEDVSPRTLILVKQELIKKEWGPERYGW